MIRKAARQFLQTLTPELRKRVLFPFPKGQTPVAIGFGGLWRGPVAANRAGHDVAFDVDGHPKADDGADRGPHGGTSPNPNGPHGNHGPNGTGPAAAEKYGDAVWTNFPVDIVQRPGVQMGEFTDGQRDAAQALLRVILSPMGYQKVEDIISADQAVKDAGPDYAAGTNVYTLGLFGEPNSVSPWMIQFGGHHLGLNVTFVGDKAVCAPLHTGILPARFEKDGRIIRGLGRENDKAFDLVTALTPDQIKTATIDHNVSDLLFGPGHADAKLSPQGLKGSELNGKKRGMLLSLAREWVGLLNDSHAAERLKAIEKSLDDTYFAWSGPTTHEPGVNGESYFRIHGPNLLIEHAPQQNQGGFKVHVHTVMRELGNDYAKQLL